MGGGEGGQELKKSPDKIGLSGRPLILGLSQERWQIRLYMSFTVASFKWRGGEGHV